MELEVQGEQTGPVGALPAAVVGMVVRQVGHEGHEGHEGQEVSPCLSHRLRRRAVNVGRLARTQAGYLRHSF